MSKKNKYVNVVDNSSNNKKKEPTFLELKAKWMTTKFIEEKLWIFRKKGEEQDVRVERFRDQIRMLEDRDYYMIGYGSLMNICDVPRTIRNCKEHELGYISGWERVFNMGSPLTGSYLNVRRNDDVQNMIVSVITVNVRDMPSIIAREINYEFIEQKVLTKDGLKAGLMVVGATTSKEILRPQLNYLHLCIAGADNLDPVYGAENFIETTNTMSGTLKDWFKNTNFAELMKNQMYLSR